LRVRTIEFETLLDKNGFERLRVRLRVQKNELIDVVYQYESFIEEKWQPIIRYDCAHGFFHRDVLLPGDIKEKSEMNFDSLKQASRYAEHDIKDRWEWYKERYVKKLKK